MRIDPALSRMQSCADNWLLRSRKRTWLHAPMRGSRGQLKSGSFSCGSCSSGTDRLADWFVCGGLGRGRVCRLKHAKASTDHGQLDDCQEVNGQLLVPRRHPAVLLQPVEAPLDDIAPPV